MLRCREATDRRMALGWKNRDRDEQLMLMRALGNVSTARLALGDSYRDEALRYLSAPSPPGPRGRRGPRRPRAELGQIAAAYFSLALDEYREALKRDPTSAAALTHFARVFWEWRQGAADRDLLMEPRLAHAREAEWNARRAVAMIEAKLDRAPRGLIVADRSASAQQEVADSVPPHLRPSAATALASLGSVLLGQARPHEALGVLASARTLAPEHPTFDDVRWMLGQALLCSASKEALGVPSEVRRRGDDSWRDRPELQAIDALRQDASAVLDRVRDHERVREGRPFAGRTDVTGASNACRRDWLGPATEREGRIQYVLKQVPPRRGRSYLCGRIGVRARGCPDRERTSTSAWRRSRAPASRGRRGGAGATVGRDLAGPHVEPLLLLGPARKRGRPAALHAAAARPEREAERPGGPDPDAECPGGPACAAVPRRQAVHRAQAERSGRPRPLRPTMGPTAALRRRRRGRRRGSRSRRNTIEEGVSARRNATVAVLVTAGRRPCACGRCSPLGLCRSCRSRTSRRLPPRVLPTISRAPTRYRHRGARWS